MRQAKIEFPYSPGDTLWAVIGDQVRACEVEAVNVHLYPDHYTTTTDVSFTAPDPFLGGRENIYREMVTLYERSTGCWAAYPTNEEAEDALQRFGPDTRFNKSKK